MSRPVIGLVGQVCAGKSAVAAAFQRRGARVRAADRWVHELYGRDDVKAEVRSLCGGGVFDSGGEVDRRKLGAAVFADAGLLEALTRRVVYPRVGAALERETAAFRAATGPGAAPALVLDAPTLLEAGREPLCDRLLFVAAPRERRLAWALARRGWAPEELERRERHLLDEVRKRARCHAAIENSGTLEDLDRRVAELWKAWVEES